MRPAFTATETNFNDDEYALVCGVTGEGEYLVVQRDSENSHEDWGIHLEYGDQSNGGYDWIAGCHLTRTCLTVDLSTQFGRLAGVTGFDVTLSIDDPSFDVLRKGLKRVFRGRENVLRLD